MSKFVKGINSKNAKAITKERNIYIFNFHQVIYSIPSISCPTLELLAVTVFDESSFLLPNLQRAITKKMLLFLFSQSSLLIILYKLTKFKAPSCNGY